MLSRTDKLIFNATDHFNAKQYFLAYSLLNQALQFIDQNRHFKDYLYCQLSMLNCKLLTATIDISDAQNELEKLRQQDEEHLFKEDMDDLRRRLSNLRHLRNMADYQYAHAYLINQIICSDIEDDTFDYEDDSNQDNVIAMEILNLHKDNVEEVIQALEKAIIGGEHAIDIYYSLGLHKSAGTTNVILRSLHEKLADKCCDYANDEMASRKQKIQRLKKANEHYKIAIESLNMDLLTNREYANQSIWLDLSVLYTLEELIKIDADHSNIYIEQIMAYFENERFKNKLRWVSASDIRKVEDKLAAHRQFCDEFQHNHKKRKTYFCDPDETEERIEKRHATLEERFSHMQLSLHQSNTSMITEQSHEETNTTTTFHMTEAEINATQTLLILSNSSRSINNVDLAPSSRESSCHVPNTMLFQTPVQSKENNLPTQTNASDHRTTKEYFKFGIEQFANAFTNFKPHCMSELLREIARFHAVNFDHFHKNQNTLAEIILSLYEKSIILDYKNDTAKRELMQFRREKATYLTQQTSSQINNRARLHQHARDCQTIGATNYFFNATTKYINCITTIFSDAHQQIASNLFNHLSKNEGFIRHIATSGANSLNLMSIFINTKSLIEKQSHNALVSTLHQRLN